MKTSLYLFIGLCVAMSCTQKESNNETPTDNIASYAISLDSAAIYIKNYSDSTKRYFKEPPIQAFTIRAEDLLEALGVQSNQKVKYEYARIYLGLDFNNKFRAFLTPVDSADIDKHLAGKDIILKGRYSHRKADGIDDGAGLTVQEGEYVMDFTGPCPNSCPSDSPLLGEQ